MFGATHSAATVADALDLVRGLTYGVMADAVVVSPSLITADDVRDAVQLTRKGGTCVLTGMTSQLTRSVNIDLQDFILMNKTLAGTIFGSCNPKSDISRLARLYETGQLQPVTEARTVLPEKLTHVRTLMQSIAAPVKNPVAAAVTSARSRRLRAERAQNPMKTANMQSQPLSCTAVLKPISGSAP